MIQRNLINYPEQFAATLTRMENEIERLKRRLDKLERSR